MDEKWQDYSSEHEDSSSPADQTQPHRPHVEHTLRGRAASAHAPEPAETRRIQPDDNAERFQPLRPVRSRQPRPPFTMQEAPPVEPPPPGIYAFPPAERQAPPPRQPRRGCGCQFTLLLFITALLTTYLLFPLPTTFLMLGLDRAPEGTDASRTDTNILVRVNPMQPEVSMLSIPRDLWVPIPGVGENRINTAHYFAELAQPGSGPGAALNTVESNFGIPVRYYVRIRFDGFRDIVDSMGGLTIELEEPMSGYDAGSHRLNGEQALAFARDRAGSDDFFRMQRGQIVIRSALRQMASPAQWLRVPAVLTASLRAVDTNLPAWQIPRLSVALIRSVLSGTLDARIITREMVTPFTTNQGANVLLPDWAAINPVLFELFGS